MTTIQNSQPRVAGLARAAHLARRGRYAEAHRVLDELGGRDSIDPDLLDLLARVHAQQGELAAADECWARVQQLGVDESGSRDGRRLIAQIHARRHRQRTGRAVGVVAVVLLAGAGIAGAVVARPGQSTDQALSSELRETKTAIGDLARQVGDLQNRLDQVTLRPERALQDLRAELAGSGLILRSESGTLVVTFPVGLFPSGAVLSAEGQRALADLGAHLGRFSRDVSFTVVGHTDDIPVAPNSRYTDNADLGFARARVAAQELSAHSGLPLTTFTVTSSGAADPPFPNSTTESRNQNRTVILLVRPM
ncbi:MAG: OmpA family protein [Pseudonocardiaceae bacterium]